MLSDFGSKNNNYENHKDFGNKKKPKGKKPFGGKFCMSLITLTAITRRVF